MDQDLPQRRLAWTVHSELRGVNSLFNELKYSRKIWTCCPSVAQTKRVTQTCLTEISDWCDQKRRKTNILQSEPFSSTSFSFELFFSLFLSEWIQGWMAVMAFKKRGRTSLVRCHSKIWQHQGRVHLRYTEKHFHTAHDLFYVQRWMSWPV